MDKIGPDMSVKKPKSIWAEFDVRLFVIFLVTTVLPAAVIVGLTAWLVVEGRR